jgi:gas vesicle protein
MENNNKILIAAGIGLAVGGILGILFAPDKGADTRNKIKESANKLADTFRGNAAKIKRNVNTAGESIKQKMDFVDDKVNEYI